MESLKSELERDLALAEALTWDPHDATLSGSERALATIVHCLTAEFDALDGTQQRALATALTRQTEATENAENYARRLFATKTQAQ